MPTATGSARLIRLSLALSRSLPLTPPSLATPLSLEQEDLMPQQLVKKVQLKVTEVRGEFMVQALFSIVLHDIVM